jgi:hypothetical protein
MSDFAAPAWRPTHLVPDGGLGGWTTPSADLPPTPLQAGLPVQVLQSQGAFANVRCSNGWETWVEAGRLVPIAGPPPPPADAQVDPHEAELRGLLDQALDGYLQLLNELENGQIDEDQFKRRSFRTGMVVHDDKAWLYDLTRGVWIQYDGIGFAALGEGSGGSG